MEGSPIGKFFYIAVLLLLVFLVAAYILFPRPTTDVSRAIVFSYDQLTKKTGDLYPVIARPPQTRYDTLIVSTKERPRPIEGTCAEVSGVCFGIVTGVQSSTAEITLFSSPLLETTVSVESFIKNAEGLGGGSLRVLVPLLNEEGKGDIPSIIGAPVVYQETGDRIGTVVMAETLDSTAAERYVYAHLEVSPFDIQEVSLRSKL